MQNQLISETLGFNKSALVELNDQELQNTDSGITPTWIILAGVAIGIAIETAGDHYGGE